MKLKYFITCLLFIAPLILFASSASVCNPLPGSATVSRGKVYNAVVDINGSGDYTSVQEAINAMPAGRKAPWLIFIKNGTYEELIRVPKEKTFIHLIGEDKDHVIITYKINCADPDNENDKGRQFSKVHVGQRDCATMVIEASDFYAENISFENSWGVEAQSGPQALAIKTGNDRFAFYNCKFRSFQDTWQTSTSGLNDRTYVANCWIEGAVDYFYGGGNAYVENSTLYCVRSGSVIVAPSHKEGTKWGYVFDHCIIDGNGPAADGRSKLGRPWHDKPVAVYLNSIMNIPLHPEGWTDMGPAPKMFAEYNSRTPDGQPVDLSRRRTWYKQSPKEGGQRIEGLTAVLNREEVKKYTYDNIIKDADEWDPRSFFKAAGAPGSLKIASGVLRWKGGREAIGYIVYYNDKVIGFTSSGSFPLPQHIHGRYAVRSVNRYGSLGSISEQITN